MTEQPLFSRLDADRILRRTAEIEGAEEGRTLTIDEIRAIAEEAGFAARALERAIVEVREAGQEGTRRPPVRKSGIVVTRLSVTRELPVEIDSEELMEVVRLVQPYREGPANIQLEEQEVTWRDRKGLRFAVYSGGGVTEIRVHVSKILIRRGRWMGWVKSAADRLERLVWLVADRSG